MTSQEKAINIRYLFLTYKPKKKPHQYIHLFLLLVLVCFNFSEKYFWPQYMYHKMSPNNGFRWCPLGKLSHLRLEQLLYEEKNDDLITEEELKKIHPDLNHNFTSPKMNSGVMSINHNYPENIIDDTEDFCQYRSLLLSGYKGKPLHPTTIKVTTAKLDGGSNSHVFTYTKLYSYIRPVQYNVQILNDSKAPAKGFVLAIIKKRKQTLLYHYGHNIICHRTHKTK